MKAANSHSTGLVQSMRDFAGVGGVLVMVMRSQSVSVIPRRCVSDRTRNRIHAGWHGFRVWRLADASRNDGGGLMAEHILKP